MNILILRRKVCTLTVHLAPYSYSVLGKIVENLAFQKQKITHLHYFIYTKSATLSSRQTLTTDYVCFFDDRPKIIRRLVAES